MTNDELKVTRPALRYFGGKWRIAPWIISHFRPHDTFTDSYGGGASVLIRKPRAHAEIYNDLDGEITNVFEVLRDCGRELRRRLELTPYSRIEFNRSYERSADPVEQARRTLVRSWMGYGGNLTRLNTTGELQRTGFRAMPSRNHCEANDWCNYHRQLNPLIERLQGVIIETLPALTILKRHDRPGTLHYVDPTYVHSTRTSFDIKTKRGYRFEMTDRDHRELLTVLRSLRGNVVLSGYETPLYNRLLSAWRTAEQITHADWARPRKEMIWMNF